MSFIGFRKYANTIKKNLIVKYTKRKGIVIDLGSGKGGDLVKYSSTDFEKCFLVEPYFHIELKRRLSKIENKDKFKIIVETAEYNSLQKRINARADNIYLFFSLNFFNDITLPSLLNNINNMISKEGKVVFAYMDGKRVLEMLNKCNGKCEFNYYNIYNIDKCKGLETGHKVKVCVNGETISMKGQYEYLIPHDALVECMIKLNFKLIETCYFNDYSNIERLDKQYYDFISMYRYDVFKKE